MVTIAADYPIVEFIWLAGRIGLLLVLLGLTYHAYWKYHPSRQHKGAPLERPADIRPTTDP